VHIDADLVLDLQVLRDVEVDARKQHQKAVDDKPQEAEHVLHRKFRPIQLVDGHDHEANHEADVEILESLKN
jgi:hypothetical protein